MQIIKITIANYEEYIVVSDSIDKACEDLLDYLNKEDLYFSSDRKIKEIEIIATKVCFDDYKNIYVTD